MKGRKIENILSLEKRHYKQGNISQLKVNYNDFATSDQRILSECEFFYTNLYTSNVTSPSSIATSEFFVHENNSFLNEEESPLTEKECLAALKSMEPERKPRDLTAYQQISIRSSG